MTGRFHTFVLALAVGGTACSSDSEGDSPRPDAGPDGRGSGGSSGNAGTGGSGGTSAGASGLGGTSGAAGTGASAGSAGRGGSGGALDAGGCTAAANCASGQSCCVTMSIENNALRRASATCTATCNPREGSTGSGALITSVSCATASNCATVRNEFGVPYPRCCSVPGFAVGVCVSETYAAATFEPAGGTCL